MTKKLCYLAGKEYDVSGSAGNAFAVMGTLSSWMKQLGVPKSDIDEVMAEAMSGDYEHLLATLSEATGVEFVDDFGYGQTEGGDKIKITLLVFTSGIRGC